MFFFQMRMSLCGICQSSNSAGWVDFFLELLALLPDVSLAPDVDVTFSRMRADDRRVDVGDDDSDLDGLAGELWLLTSRLNNSLSNTVPLAAKNKFFKKINILRNSGKKRKII